MLVSGGILSGHVLAGELSQSCEPLRVFSRAGEELKVDPVQELHLEVVNVLDLHSGDVGPCLVGKRVVVEELVRQDQCSGEESVLGTVPSVDNLVGGLEVDHELLNVFE